MHPNIQQQLTTLKESDVHKRKLQSIRQGRKNNLRNQSAQVRARSISTNYPYSYNSQYVYNHRLPYNQLNHIKQKKHETFMNEYNYQQQKICTQNLKLFTKLNHQMHRRSQKNNCYQYYSKGNPSPQHPKKTYLIARNNADFDPNQTYHTVTYDGKKSFNRQQNQITVQRENQRIKSRIQSCSSSISYRKQMQDEKSRQKLRNSLLRYDQGLELKSTKYVKNYTGSNNEINSMTISTKNNNSYVDNKRTKSARPNVAKFYNRDFINKNKIENYAIKKPNTNQIRSRSGDSSLRKLSLNRDKTQNKNAAKFLSNARMNSKVNHRTGKIGSFFATDI